MPNQINMPTIQAAGQGSSSFYFYNAQTVAQGKNQFQNKWGKRTLEDNWRRRNKKMTLLQAEDEADEEQTSAALSETGEETTAQTELSQVEEDTLVTDNKTREYYLQQIPLTEEDMEASNIIIADGLFNMGMIYKDKLEDKNLSVSTFEELERRFPDNKYRLDYYYQIYLLALRYKDAELADKYRNKMLADYPESDFTKAVSDPNYEYNMRMMDSIQDSLYETTYNSYLAEDTATVRRNFEYFNTAYPLGELMPKFMFLNALTYVQSGDVDAFKTELTILTEKFPNADVTELANEMLKGLLKGRKLMQGSFSSITWDLRFGIDDDQSLSDEDLALKFSDEKATSHRMLLIYTTGSIDKNQLLYAVAAYNFANFRVESFDLSFEDMRTITILTISGFNNFEEVLDYYKKIYSKDGYASALDGIVTFFPFSDENYDVLMHGKTLEEYMSFFIEHYGNEAPELVNRWRIRVDSDRKEADEQKSLPTESNISEKNEQPAESSIKVEPIKDKIEQKETIKTEAPLTESINAEIAVRPKPLERVIKEMTFTEDEDTEHPKAKGDNLFRNLFRKVKDLKEFQVVKDGIEKVRDAALEDEEISGDTIVEKKTLQRVDGELTFEQLQEIRKKENEEKAVQADNETTSKEEARKNAAELKKQQEKEREQLRKEKAKAAKERLKQKEKERKAKEKASKERQKQKAKERKAKEAARKAALKEKTRNNKK